MDLILEKDLEHQQKAVENLAMVFNGANITKPLLPYENPVFQTNDSTIVSNITKLQKELLPDRKGLLANDSLLNVDIKMETGTGKTYVYTKSIFELHKEYGFNKFIIAVPSLAIKSGTEQFISDSYVKKHFSDICGYNCEIELGVVESPKKTKKGFLAMPSSVREFVVGSSQNTKKIHVLLVNMQLLTRGKLLSRDDYDYLVEGFNRPFDALKSTKPIVIIDEPHRFSRDQSAYETIVKELAPQAIIRFGATFPDLIIGKGKNKKTIKDYNNLVYELNSCDSFNKNLIKGIYKEHLESTSTKNEKVKLVSIESKNSVTFHLKKKGQADSKFVLNKGDSLTIIDDSFEGVSITAIGKSFIELSNGQIKTQGEEFDTDIYSTSYQEQMLKLAIERHFETERQNFSGRKYKIKTLALFFIDDITSYRNDSENEKVTYLKNTFEKLLLDKINELLSDLSDTEREYKSYLQATKNDISGCHAGYFSQDNSSSDEAIAGEVSEILHNKKQLLSIYNADGSFNVRRFLFSKWTLKEGWDNPNIFTITKLRSSGSENSKLQEVGRGLRLPVNESGNRISNEEFKLRYIVDFTEADFADKLVSEINGDIPMSLRISIDEFDKVAKLKALDPDALFIELIIKKYINRNYELIKENRDAFFTEYPEFSKGVHSGKITDTNKKPTKSISIRKANFNELKELWQTLNKKYFLFYDKDINDDIPKVLSEIFNTKDVFEDVVISSVSSAVVSSGETMKVEENIGVQYTIEKPLKYNEFLKRIGVQTSVSIDILHNVMVEYCKSNKVHNNQINEFSANNIIKAFREWKINETQRRFKYTNSNYSSKETALTHADGSPKEMIVQGRIGTKIIDGTPSEKYLYDTIAFDSPLEKENILTDGISEVVVYGKIPRSSISIPTTVGETYSPDFMYVVKKSDGTKELNIIIETKAVENKSVLRGVEDVKINCAKIFFEQLKIDGYNVHFKEQLNNKKVKNIIEDVLKS